MGHYGPINPPHPGYQYYQGYGYPAAQGVYQPVDFQYQPFNNHKPAANLHVQPPHPSMAYPHPAMNQHFMYNGLAAHPAGVHAPVNAPYMKPPQAQAKLHNKQ